MLMSGALDLLLPLPLYLLLLLGGLALHAWRVPAAAPARRWRWGWTALAGWAWLLSAPITSNEAIRWIEGPPPDRSPPPRDARSLIVVLASGELRPRLDQAGWERLAGAARLWRHTGGQLVFVGGPGLSQQDSLGGLMAGYAQTFGLPAEAVRHIGGGTNTHEDILRASALARAHEGPLWLVTSALHMPRALATARQQGWQVRPYPVDYQQLDLALLPSCLPSNGGPIRFAEALHELIGRGVYRLRGWSH
ncbi:MAG: YdcF family protein [Burkholderiaceae bacterium]|nr:YdcF family protein [Burkholderiaceae bacterium]